MQRALVLALTLAAAVAAGQLHEVPAPATGWVTDTTGTLRLSTIAEANAVAEAVNRDGFGQIGVAVVGNARGQAPRRYATGLFNSWGIGHQARNDGVLLFIALEDRAAEIVLGSGIDSGADVSVTDRIMASNVVANMKRGDPDAAVLQATRALADHLRTRSSGARAPSGALQAVPLVLLGLSLVGGGFGVRRWLRNRPRACEACANARVRLDEADDDAHLDAGQQAEERFGSVDYDVWWCEPCGNALVLRHGRWFSGRSRCRRCSYKTASSTTLTLRSATEYSGGLVEVTERCGHCQHVHTHNRSTPRLSRSSSSGSSGFGGGSSSGGGSSGRW